MNGPGLDVVLVWQQPDGLWRWRWQPHPGDDAAERDSGALVRFKAFDSAEEAEESARSAYPSVPIHHLVGRRRHWEPLRLVVVLALAGIAVMRNLRGQGLGIAR